MSWDIALTIKFYERLDVALKLLLVFINFLLLFNLDLLNFLRYLSHFEISLLLDFYALIEFFLLNDEINVVLV